MWISEGSREEMEKLEEEVFAGSGGGAEKKEKSVDNGAIRALEEKIKMLEEGREKNPSDNSTMRELEEKVKRLKETQSENARLKEALEKKEKGNEEKPSDNSAMRELEEEVKRLQETQSENERLEAEVAALKAESAGLTSPPPPPDAAQLQAEIDELRRQLRSSEKRALAASSFGGSMSGRSERGGEFSQGRDHQAGAAAEEEQVLWQVAGEVSHVGRGEQLHVGRWRESSEFRQAFHYDGEGSWELTLLSDGKKILFAAKEEKEREEWVAAVKEFCES